jgi:hypothetical protein
MQGPFRLGRGRGPRGGRGAHRLSPQLGAPLEPAVRVWKRPHGCCHTVSSQGHTLVRSAAMTRRYSK